MEALTRLVSESLARHGFDRPVDYRRLKWSRWLPCESHHSLLFVPSKPGVFALAEEIAPVVTAASAVSRREASGTWDAGTPGFPEAEGRSPQHARRRLAVTQFFEADDMAFILDRMLSRYNPMRARLESGRYFVRFVVIEDEAQRRNIYGALDQWIHSSDEKNTGIGGHFANSSEPTPIIEPMAASDDSQADLFSSAEMGRVIFSTYVATAASAVPRTLSEAQGSGQATAAAVNQATPVEAPQHSSNAAKIQSPPKFPSGF